VGGGNAGVAALRLALFGVERGDAPDVRGDGPDAAAAAAPLYGEAAPAPAVAAAADERRLERATVDGVALEEDAVVVLEAAGAADERRLARAAGDGAAPDEDTVVVLEAVAAEEVLAAPATKSSMSLRRAWLGVSVVLLSRLFVMGDRTGPP
jgi:hypothetical protein